jgi:arabinan endo-1,5-alpha-L-arabinosidase
MPPHRLTRRFGHCLGLVAAAAAVAVVLGPSPASAPAPAGAAAAAPVLDVNFPDPDIVKAGGVYHAYATNGDGKNIQHATSRDLARWKVDSTDVLPVLGDWALPRRDLVWAPEVYDNGDGFTMHYTARDRASDKQCIGVALSSSADGPFRPVGDGPLVCPATQGGAIDASSYTEDGQRYLLWKNDGNCCGLHADTWLYLWPTSWDGTRTVGEPVGLVKQDRDWEGPLVEAPTLVKRGGRYVLFYSADGYSGAQYKTGYAVAKSLTGPYTKAANPLMTTDTFSGAVRGPGGQDVVTGPDGRDHIVFHGWSADYQRRAMYVADLGFANGYPVVRGSKVLYQAENARVQHASVRDAAGASDGRAVGGIDHAEHGHSGRHECGQEGACTSSQHARYDQRRPSDLRRGEWGTSPGRLQPRGHHGGAVVLSRERSAPHALPKAENRVNRRRDAGVGHSEKYAGLVLSTLQ